MQVHCLLLILGLGATAFGASDDHQVEQVRSPHVSAFDLGTHMSGHFAPPSEFDGYQSDFGPYGKSVQHEVQEEQRFVNGQPVYEKRDERRYEDGRLVHQDGHERGNPSTAPVVVVPGGYRSSSSSSRSSYSSSQSGGGYGTAGSSFESAGASGDFENNFRDDVQRLRERLHQGTSVIHAPAQTTSVRDEKRHESHFVDGQQVYHKNEERRYEDGRLVHNVAEEEGSRNAGGQHVPGGVNSLTSRHSSSQETASSHIRSGTEYSAPSDTAYRASYWRPGPQERRVSTSHRQTTTSNSSTYRPRPTRIRTATSNTLDSGNSQVSYRPASQVVTSNNQPSYRPSYTPSRTVERVPQRQSAVSTHSSSSQTRQYSAAQHRPVVPVTTRSNAREELETSSYENRQLSSSSEYEQQQEDDDVSSESQSAYTRRQFSTDYGSGRYVQRPSITTVAPQTASRITDTYSVPYSIRSPSYQPSQFANYSAWSHWKKESTVPAQTVSSSSSQNSYESETQYSHNTDQLLQTSEDDDDESDDGYASSDSSRRTQQSQHVRMLRPGFLYEDHLDQSNDIDSETNRRSEVYQSSSTNVAHSSDYSTNQPSSSSQSSEYSSRTSSASSRRPVNAAIGSGSGGSTSLSFTVDVGEGERVRLGNLNSVNTQTDQERYDISPIVDGSSSLSSVDNEIETSYSGETPSSSEINSRLSSHYSTQRQHGRTSTTYSAVPASGSAYDRSTHVRNQTRNTFTSQIQPLVSSYKTETRTSRRYLNGKLVSETRFNRYYENGVLVHENQTERSRDEMVTDGINVSALDLSVEDLARYGVIDTNAVPVAHSQRLDFRQEKEFVDGNQVYESTHERRFQDGELIHEDHEERDRDELAALGRTIYNQDDSDSLGFGHGAIGRGSYTSNFIQNRNYGHSLDTGNYDGYRSGNRQRTGVGETVTVNVTPVTRTRKTEIRREQEFQDGQPVYDLRHERQFTDGNLIHEQYSEKGPEELGTAGHRDALQDILTGRTLTTASEANYKPASATTSQSHQSQYQGSTYTTHGQAGSVDYTPSYQRENSNYGSSYESQETANAYQGATVQSGRDRGLVGTKLLNSGASTYVIGGGGIENFESLNSASSLSQGHTAAAGSSSESGVQYNSDGSRRVSGGYYGSFGGNNAGGSQSRSSSSYASEQSSTYSSSQHPTNDRAYGTSGYDAFGNFGAYASGDRTGGRGISHRREMEVEEHYENGQLVRGHEKDKEWKDDQLLRHEERSYGEGDARHGQSASTVISPGLTSSSNFATYGSSSEGYGARGSFSAHSPGYVAGSGAQYNSQSSGYQSQSSDYGAQSGYQSGYQSSGYGAGSSAYGSQHAGFGVTGYPAGGYRTHRREMEVEEHYENGQLVRGREEQKEWEDDDLLRHDYGEV